MQEKWLRIEEKLNSIAVWISIVNFTAMIFLITINVICRYLFAKSFNWAEEVAYLCFNWAVFFGVAIVYRNQGLTAIDLFVNKLRGKVKQAVLILGYTLVTLANAGLIFWGFKFAISAWARKSASLHIPYFFYDVSIPLAGIIMLCYSVKFLIMTICGEELTSAALEDRV